MENKTENKYAPIFEFLLGLGEYDGVWFMDHNNKRQGAFWWRTDLKKYLDAHVVPLQKTLKEIDAFIDTCNDEYKREYADLELKVRRQSDHIEVLKTEIKALKEEIERLKKQRNEAQALLNQYAKPGQMFGFSNLDV